MNYHHIFHAGNLCDIAKHTALTLVVNHLAKKEKPFFVLDTHAGAGLYDLKCEQALKTNESEKGILALLNAPDKPDLAEYYKVLAKANPLWNGAGTQGFRIYPGSPLFTLGLLRPNDRLVAIEKHPTDAQALKQLMPLDRRVHTHCRDGYESINAFLPPQEKRGLVLIDPPFEQPDEFQILLKNVQNAHNRWPNGTFMIWYPVKDRPAIWQFHQGLISSKIPKILVAEFVYEEDQTANKLCGSGLIFINPPWKLDEEIASLYPALHKALNTPFTETTVNWLTQ